MLRLASSFLLFVTLAVPARPQQAVMERERVPRHIVYGMLFHEVVVLDREADELQRQGRPAGYLLTRYQERFDLSPTDSASLRKVAAMCMPKLSALNQAAAAIISTVKSEYRGKARGPGSQVPAPPPELLRLDAQRKETVEHCVSELEGLMGRGAFAAFDARLNEHIAHHVRIVPVEKLAQ